MKTCSKCNIEKQLIDSTKGYTKDNCQVISFRANFLKSNATIEELETVINFLKNSKQT